MPFRADPVAVPVLGLGRAVRRVAVGLGVSVALALGVVALAPAAALADDAAGVVNGRWSISQVFPVQRVPAYPPCTSASSYGSWTVTVNDAALSTSYPFSEATGGPVDIGDDYLTIVESGDSSAPWGIARFTPEGDEVRYDGSAWITEPAGGWTTEVPFTAAGQLYGVGAEGFLHASVPYDYGNFFSNLGVLVAGQAVTYSSLPEYNDCTANRAIARFDAMGTYPVPDAPIARTELSILAPSAGTLGPAFAGATLAYDVTVPAGTESIIFAAVPAEPGADVTVTAGGGTASLTGDTTGPLALAPGANVVTFQVTASDASTRTYTVTVTVATDGGGDGDADDAAGDDALPATGADAVTTAALLLLAAGLLGAGAAVARRAAAMRRG